jgi:ATP-dependent helicase HrpA
MQPNGADNKGASSRDAIREGRRGIDAACTRDRGRLLGLWAKWNAKPGDGALRSGFETALRASVATRDARAATLPRAEVDAGLPIATEAERIVALIRAHPVVVIAGETGSGKTTQLPKLCLAAGRGAAGMIGCTQPRRIAARAVARRVAEELQVPVGGAVGYQVRFNDNVGEQTAVKFMTDGILLAEIAGDRWLSRYDTLIIDEAHERSLNIDFLLGYLKQLLPRRPDLKVIVTSATIDTERFAAHFGDAPVVNVEGRGFPVEVRWRPLGEGQDPRSEVQSAKDAKGAKKDKLEEGPSLAHLASLADKKSSTPARSSGITMIDGIVAACDEIARSRPIGDTLVFLPGEREIRDAHRALEARKYRHTEVLPLYARLSAKDQDRVFHPGTQRRIVLATNVAETSLTVPRIHHVVDPGVARVKRYSPRQKLDRLHIEPVSQASADQRKGRCGRIAPGTCYRLYSEADFLSRPAYTDPEIRRAALAGVILRMLTLGLGGIEGRVSASPRRASEQSRNGDARIIENFPFLEPPDPRAIADGWQQLAELGAVDASRKLTATGRAMAKLPVDVKLARMLVAAQKHGVLAQMLVVASFLGIQDPRERPADARAAADTAHAQFADAKSEFVGILKLWDAYRTAHEDLTQSQLRKWADRNFLGFLRLREWRELHRQLKLQCEELGWGGQEQIPLDPPFPKGEDKRLRSSVPFPPLKKGGRGDSRAQRAALSAHDARRRHTAPEAAAKPESSEPHQYALLHRALIAGLPAQFGHLTERGVYDGPRGRKFQLFPGSTLAKKPPPWVLSATLLDTEKVWAMTNAAIEPEWAIDELPHLLARRHHDPRWSRAQGRVIGSEQISLFGLVLIPKKPVHYGALYPEEARQIFLRDALVTGEINTRSVFVARNLKTLEAAKEEEAKLRRAGLVIDEDAQAQWYHDRIPAHIVSAQALDAWTAKLSKDERAALEWTRDDLLAADTGDASRFPAFIALGDARLAVRYRFDPGAPDDGMTVVVPLHLLNALDAARLSWLAPGFVQDKAAALIKSLPKALRRNFVPAPDFARAFAEAHPAPEADSIEGALARFLKRLGGVEIAATDFDDTSIEPHLHANLRLLDVPQDRGDAPAPAGHVIAESRDLAGLRTRFGKCAADAFAQRASEGLAQAGLTAFPETPVPVSVAGAGGVPAYPALQDNGDSASLAVHAQRSVAQRLHPQGVRRLLAIALADRIKQARRQLPVQPKTALLYAAIESGAPRPGKEGDRLREDLMEGAFAALAADGLEEVRDAQAFAARRDAVAKSLFPEAMRRLQQAEAILLQVAQVRQRLDSPLLGWASGNLDDMRAHLEALVPAGFLRDVPAAALAEYPRYLKALALRAERALRDPAKDQARMLEMHPFVHAVRDALRGDPSGKAWQELRWDLEELRVATFAQELGAKGHVSPKKLAARISQLQQ